MAAALPDEEENNPCHSFTIYQPDCILCVVTLAGSQSKRTAELQYMNADMELTNKSMVADVSDWKQPFDDAFCEKLLKIDGVKEIHKLNYSTIVVPWEPDFRISGCVISMTSGCI